LKGKNQEQAEEIDYQKRNVAHIVDKGKK